MASARASSRSARSPINTSTTGYQEIVTDPSYCGQIIVMTATQIGNVGVNAEDTEEPQGGVGTARASRSASSRRWTRAGARPALARSLPARRDGARDRGHRHARAHPRCCAIRARCAARSTPHVAEIEAVLTRVRAHPVMDGLDLVPRVTCKARYAWDKPSWRAFDDRRTPPPPPIDRHVVAYDFGMKDNIPRQLRDLGCRVTVVPATTRPRATRSRSAPMASSCRTAPAIRRAVTYGVVATKELCASGKPVFGICLGHQILGSRARRASRLTLDVRPPRRQSPGARSHHGQGRDHVAEPRVRHVDPESLPPRACT